MFRWNDQDFGVCASIGIAQIQPGNTAMEQTMALPDTASLRLKRKGGDRVYHASKVDKRHDLHSAGPK